MKVGFIIIGLYKLDGKGKGYLITERFVNDKHYDYYYHKQGLKRNTIIKEQDFSRWIKVLPKVKPLENNNV